MNITIKTQYLVWVNSMDNEYYFDTLAEANFFIDNLSYEDEVVGFFRWDNHTQSFCDMDY